MNISFNSTEEFIDELDRINDPPDGKSLVLGGVVRIGLLEAIDETSTDVYLSSTFVTGDDVYELLVHCGRNDQYVTDGTDEYLTIRESLEDTLADKDLEIRSGRIDG